MFNTDTLMIFVLACFVGYYVILKVTPALHAPLMSVTNAISSVIIIAALGCITSSIKYPSGSPAAASWFGIIAASLVSINVVGGFVLTNRMLSMFSSKGGTREKFNVIIPIVAVITVILIRAAGFSMLSTIIASTLFILALNGLSSAKTAKKGNVFGIAGMTIAIMQFAMSRGENIITTFNCYYGLITVFAVILGGLIGYTIAKRINMTALPQLVAAFHSLVGLAAVFIACSTFIVSTFEHLATSAVELSGGAAVGAITFTGSLVAFGKLQGFMSGSPIQYAGQRKINLLLGLAIVVLIAMFVMQQSTVLFSAIIIASFVIGYLLIIPIGGADMPVVVSMLNSYSGWAAVGIGFTLHDNVLVIVGALVGASGAILSSIMCKGMNRSLINVIFGGANSVGTIPISSKVEGIHNVKLCSAEDAGFIVKNAESIIIVPGYGMAVSQAQHAIKELADILKTENISVKYAIHPVAGRMPGHMNVLLAEANIPYEDVFEIDDINREFGSTDVVIVIGANDITNPAAKNDPSSPIYGMPILDVGKAQTVLFVKRSIGSGYAGIDNSLFYQSNTMMILGDAKKVIEGILKGIKE
jgi:NAD(P) transhydrogenase subunit beta